MKIILRVQYGGRRARELAVVQHKKAQFQECIREVRDELADFNIPTPEFTKIVWDSGFVLCHWTVDENDDTHKAIQRGYQKAIHDKRALNELLIRHMSLTDSGLIPLPRGQSRSLKREGIERNFEAKRSRSIDYSSAHASASAIRNKSPPTAPKALLQSTRRSPLEHDGGKRIDRTDTLQDIPALPRAVPTSEDLSTPSSASSANLSTENILLSVSQSTAIQSLLNKISKETTVKMETQSFSIPSQDAPQDTSGSASASQIHSYSAASISRAPTPLAATPHATAASISTSSIPSLFPIPKAVTSEPLAAPSAISHISGSAGTAREPVFRPSTSSPNGQNQVLNRQLWDIRRQANALKAREQSLLDKLNATGSSESLASTSTGSSDDHAELKRELSDMRARLQKEIVARLVAESTLETERSRRIHAEGIIADARRECSTPFVVPSLMDAFVKLSQLATDALAEDMGDAKGVSV